MTMSNEQLHEKAKDPRLAKQPAWVQQLIAVLDVRLHGAEVSRERTEKKAAEEVEAARALLAEGPADSDTFLWLPGSAVSDDEFEVRPLGRGVTVEFRHPNMANSCGYEVRMKDGRLHVGGINQLTVRPEDTTSLTIADD